MHFSFRQTAPGGRRPARGNQGLGLLNAQLGLLAVDVAFLAVRRFTGGQLIGQDALHDEVAARLDGGAQLAANRFHFR